MSQAQFEALYEPHQSPATLQAPSRFRIDVLVEQLRYRYEFAIDARAIRHEMLLVFRSGKPQRWFERRVGEEGRSHWSPFSPMFTGQRELWRRATHERALFLSTSMLLNAASLAPLNRFISGHLDIVLEAQAELPLIEKLLSSPAFKQRVLRTLGSQRNGVSDVRIAGLQGSDAARRPLTAARARQVEFFHAHFADSKARWLATERESRGLQRAFLVLALLLHAQSRDATLILDDLDDSIDLIRARQLLSPDPSSEQSTGLQLLATSCNLTHLDLSALKREELSLIGTGEDGVTWVEPVRGRVGQWGAKLIETYQEQAALRAPSA